MSEKVEMTPGIRALWQEGLVLDLTIEVEDQEFKVHKVVMAALCDYFKAMFSVGMKDSSTDRVRIHGFSSLAVSNLIDFIYTSQFGREIATPEELMKLAMYLQFQRGIKVCEECLYEEIDNDNCFSTLVIFQSFSLQEGIEVSIRYIKENFDDILEECNPDTMPLKDFINLMEYWNRSEWELFDLALQWLQNDDRKQHVNQVMGHVRFLLMSPTEIALIKNMDIYTRCAGSWCELIEKAIVYQNLPTHKKVLDDSDQSRVRSVPTPVCFPAVYDTSDYLYAQQTKFPWKKLYADMSGPNFRELKRQWEYHDTFNGPEFQEEPFAVVTVNNFLIVCGYGNYWNIFDPRTFTWSPMVGMGTERNYCAVVYHNKFLYALGGALRREHIGGPFSEGRVMDTIAKYDFETNTWTVISSKLPEPLQGHAAISICGSIYVTGGWKSAKKNEDFSQRMDSFDPTTDTWKRKAPMTRSSRNLRIQLMWLYDQEVILVLDENLAMQIYHPDSDEWTVWHGRRPRGIKWHDEGRLVASKDYLFLLNFIHDDGVEEEITYFRGIPVSNQRSLACVRWDIRENGPTILEVNLEEYPICQDDWDDTPPDSFSTLLAINYLCVKKKSDKSLNASSEDETLSP